MKVAVFGATGGTGSHIVNKLINGGHEVTALVRNPSKLDGKASKIRVIQGDARDDKKVLETVNGQDVVLSAFGPRSIKKDDLQTVFISNLVNAMDKSKVNRLIELSAWGAGDDLSRSKIAFKIFRKTILKNLFDDKNRAEKIISSSSLNYTMVRPGRLVNKPGKGKVKASLSGEGIGSSISREDVANFMVEQMDNDIWARSCPIIGY